MRISGIGAKPIAMFDKIVDLLKQNKVAVSFCSFKRLAVSSKKEENISNSFFHRHLKGKKHTGYGKEILTSRKTNC
ncbi:MAG: hypothetical protein PHS41_02775 [Victivallaceae bacterium]|nr:hypothetical protein [Victivallaceae bacterium]